MATADSVAAGTEGRKRHRRGCRGYKVDKVVGGGDTVPSPASLKTIFSGMVHTNSDGGTDMNVECGGEANANTLMVEVGGRDEDLPTRHLCCPGVHVALVSCCFNSFVHHQKGLGRILLRL